MIDKGCVLVVINHLSFNPLFHKENLKGYKPFRTCFESVCKWNKK